MDSGRRSKSQGPRGSKPSELLARKRQLIQAAVSNGQLDWSNRNGGSEESIDTNDSGDPLRSVGLDRRPSRRQHKTDLNLDQEREKLSAAEAKLESLSEQLRNHQLGITSGGDIERSYLSNGGSTTKSIDDVYILLAKKEKDLQLAAELGKVLLEKNDQLSKTNEKIAEDYSRKLELLEQDKHKLKRKLDLLDGEYENRLIELQTDCNILKSKLDQQQQESTSREKEKCKLIDDLVQQNQRLTSELAEATKSEELLSGQIEQLKERFSSRLSNRLDHVAQADALKEEISVISQRKQELERRLKLANEDKAQLNLALEESGDKIIFLESLIDERDSKLSDLANEINELRDSSSWLTNELESMISLNEKLASFDAQNIGDNEFGEKSEWKRSQLVDQLRELRLRSRSRIKASELILISKRSKKRFENLGRKSSDDEIESGQTGRSRQKRSARILRRREVANSTSSRNESPGGDGFSQDEEWESEDEKQHIEWAEMIEEVFSLLRNFQSDLQQRKEALQMQQQQLVRSAALANNNLYSSQNSSGAEDSGISTDENSVEKTDSVRSLVRDLSEWKLLLDSLKLLIEDLPCSSCIWMIAERSKYEQLVKSHAKLSDEMRTKEEQILDLNMSRTAQEAKVRELDERCKILSQDLANCDMPKEEIVQLAWKARDEAVERKNAAEISLAKTRIENMQISSQLMEVVQQKGDLSQKLAQFEDDIHYITQDSVKAKFTWEEYAEKLRRSNRLVDLGSASASAIPSNLVNPFTQLLNNFSMSKTSSTSNSDPPSPTKANRMLESLVQPTGDSVRNFTTNKFKLRFWQRN